MSSLAASLGGSLVLTHASTFASFRSTYDQLLDAGQPAGHHSMMSDPSALENMCRSGPGLECCAAVPTAVSRPLAQHRTVESAQLQPHAHAHVHAQDGEREKQKSYRALCWLPVEVTDEQVSRLTSDQELVLKQTTPTRVAHR